MGGGCVGVGWRLWASCVNGTALKERLRSQPVCACVSPALMSLFALGVGGWLWGSEEEFQRGISPALFLTLM